MGVISGFASAIPIEYSEGEGFGMSSSADESITEDLKCLLLSDGKIWDTDFGVGLNQYLFENPEQINHGAITSSIHEQVAKYLDSYLKILSVSYITNLEDPRLSKEALVIAIQAQSKITGSPIPVGVLVDLSLGATSLATTVTSFTGNYHNWLLSES